MNRRIATSLLTASVLMMSGLSVTHADMIVYTLDPTRSLLSLTATWDSQPVAADLVAAPPVSDSLVTQYSGSLTANRDFSADTLQITASSVVAQDNNGLFAPMSLPANYGFNQQINQSAFGAIRNLSFSLVSTPIATPTSFQADQIAAMITSGQIDYELLTQSSDNPPAFTEIEGTVPMNGSLDIGVGAAGLSDVAGVETLVLPVDAQLATMVNSQPLKLHFSGEIVATANLPEPAGVSVLIAAAPILLRRRRRR